MSGRYVGAGLRELQGQDLKGKNEPLTLDHVKKDIDKAVVQAAEFIRSIWE